MDSAEAAGHVLEAGKSGELIAVFQAIAEATTADGGCRYPPRLCRELGRAIACRSYASAVLQLCHLVNAADACGRGADEYERFFFADGRATANQYKVRLAEAVARGGWARPGFELAADGVVIRYRDGLFNVRYSRMPLLAVLFEFLVMTLGYAELEAVLGEMLAAPSAQAAVKRAANAIEGRLYRYLGDHLPSAHNQSKFNAILEFLKGRAGDGAIEIDDQTVLDFWCRRTGGRDDDGDFRMYRTVFESFVTFVRLLQAAQQQNALAAALPIGGDRSAGEVDPDALADFLEAADEWRSPLTLLAEDPASRIKFLNGREREALRLLMECGPEARLLPLSLLRAEVFGRSQARITQGMRRKLDGAAIRHLVHNGRTESYRQQQAAYDELRGHLHRVLKASLHVLMRESGSDGDGDAPAGDAGERIAEVAEEARRAFRGLERQGFDDSRLDDPDIVAGFRSGAQALMGVDRQLAGFLDVVGAIDRREPDLDGWFGRDQDIFRGHFLRLYGD